MLYLLDTNAVIKMLYGKHVSYVLKAFYTQKIQLIYHDDILNEYVEVAHRLKDYVSPEKSTAFFVLLQEYGLEVMRLGKSPILTDHDDEIFVKILNSPEFKGQKIILVTDNQKHFKDVKEIRMINFKSFTEIIRKL